jgi:hemolysin III
VQDLKPRLRGSLHTATFPLSVVAGIVLVSLSSSPRARVSTAVFAVTTSLLFGISALYHRGRWSGRAHAVLKRLDHATIFLIIAGTYTPFSVLLLPPGTARTLLWIVWTGALAGVAFRCCGSERRRAGCTCRSTLALGWFAVVYLPSFLRGGGVAVFALVAVGGGLYTVGGLVYALRRPNPSPRWFGFHEVFHALTVAAFAAHYVGVSLAAYGDQL